MRENIDLQDIDQVVVSSVVPNIMHSFCNAIRRYIGIEPLVIGPGIKTGLNIHVDVPSQVGSDRIVIAVAALAEYKAPLILMDLGTATTIEVVEPENTYLGGVIIPGVKISLDALTDRTALLPGLQLDQPKKAIGRNTIDCMRSGIMLGNACMLDGMVEHMEAELGSKATVIATGGIARFIIPMCKTPILYDKDLLVKGLAALYRENKR